MNAGERDELLAVIRLVQMRDEELALPGLGDIHSVSFDGYEYDSPPWDYFSGLDWQAITNEELLEAADQMGFAKAGPMSKADVFVNGKGLSLKSSRKAPPAIVNHTTRPGWERICNQVGVNIADLDAIIDDYWFKRQSGLIAEDVENSDQNSPFALNREVMQPLLEYFMFKGTGSRDSKHPANYLLEVCDPTNEASWNLLSPSDAFNVLWPKMKFSMRSNKGMPPDYPYMKDQAKQQSVAKWTRDHQGQFRGALHARAVH